LILVCGSRGAIVGAVAIILATWIRSAKKSWSLVFVLLFVLGLFFRLCTGICNGH
jgi:ABC-type transport system involved in multi-copper enzyme maturation permease subunit